MGPIMWKRCGFKSTQIAVFVAYTFPTACILRKSCQLSSNCICQCSKSRPSNMEVWPCLSNNRNQASSRISESVAPEETPLQWKWQPAPKFEPPRTTTKNLDHTHTHLLLSLIIDLNSASP